MRMSLPSWSARRGGRGRAAGWRRRLRSWSARRRRPRAADLLLDGLAVRLTGDYRESAPILRRAVSAFRGEGGHAEHDMRWPWLSVRAAADLFDDDSWHLLATRHVVIARDSGALGVLQIGLMYLGVLRVCEGTLDAAAALIEEGNSVIDATGSRRIDVAKLMLAACRG